MNIKRALLTLTALMLLPGLALAQAGDVTARFDTSKVWLDGTGGVDNLLTSVPVNMTCTTGLPLSQDFDVTSTVNVDFVLGDLISLDDVDCMITETVPSGFVAIYTANGSVTAGGCVFEGGDGGNATADNTCVITNTPAPVNVTVNTMWNTINEGGDEVNEVAGVYIQCNAPIAGVSGYEGYWTKGCTLFGDSSCTAVVTPDPSGSFCTTWETVQDSSVEKSNNCGSGLSIAPGVGNSCTYYYTVFFEGIPTLSQYGLAIMALLMLGVGFVGFRRFV